MTVKFAFRAFQRFASNAPENLEKLNSLRSLYYGTLDSRGSEEHPKLPPELAQEFFWAVGQILQGVKLRKLKLKTVRFE